MTKINETHKAFLLALFSGTTTAPLPLRTEASGDTCAKLQIELKEGPHVIEAAAVGDHSASITFRCDRKTAQALMNAYRTIIEPPKTEIERLEEERWLHLNSFGQGGFVDGWRRERIAEIEKELIAHYEAQPVDPETVGQTGLAALEGWGIFEVGGGDLEIQADHDSSIFCRGGNAYDDDALEFVRRRAKNGSVYHQAALKRVEVE